jgi:hypothetical protein
MFRITLVTLTVACLYLRQMEERKAKQSRSVTDAYGGDKLTIITFYATPPTVRPGEKTQLCYGVSNSTNVRMEPPVENVLPALSHCVDVSPKRTTTYKLIAEDDKGNVKTVGTTVQVH